MTTKSGPGNYPEMSKQITKDKTISKRKSKKVDSAAVLKPRLVPQTR